MKRFLAAVLACLLIAEAAFSLAEGNILRVEKADSLPNAGWQKKAVFPDAWGYADDTLAMNSMVSFHGYHGQGTLYLEIADGVTGFTLYVNGQRADTVVLHVVQYLCRLRGRRRFWGRFRSCRCSSFGKFILANIAFKPIIDDMHVAAFCLSIG